MAAQTRTGPATPSSTIAPSTNGAPARARLVDVAAGRCPPDLALTGGIVANVYSGEWLPWNVEVADGRIAYVGPRTPERGPATTIVDLAGKTLVPGYIEPHFHPWSLYNPASALEFTLASGTATLMCDNLNLVLAGGTESFRRTVDRLRVLPGHLYWVARLASQSTAPGDDETFALRHIEEQLSWPQVLATGEVTRWSEIAAGEAHFLEGFMAARRRHRRVDGHAAGASFTRLAAVVAAGVSADHEAITADEAIDRLRLGLWTLLRGSSLRRDLPDLLPIVTERGVDTRRLMMTTDGSGPLYVHEHGFIDDLLRIAVAGGVDPMTALQMVTINPATFLGLDEELGGIAPGRRATFCVLQDRCEFTPERVYVDGEVVAEGGRLLDQPPDVDWSAIGCAPAYAPPEVFEDEGLYALPAGGTSCAVPTMHYESAVIARRADRTFPVRDGVVDLADAPDCVYAALVARDGSWVTRGIISNLFGGLDGLASTYNTSAHILALGRDPRSMAVAARKVVKEGGGIAIAAEGSIRWSVPLSVAGTATDGTFSDAVEIERALSREAAAAGYPFHDVLYSLLFVTCDFLPEVRLTGRGLLEVKTGELLARAQPVLRVAPTSTL